MIRQYAVVNDVNKVINVVLWDGDTNTWNPPHMTIAILSDFAAIGDSYVNGVFVSQST